jgi:hypothetical protein
MTPTLQAAFAAAPFILLAPVLAAPPDIQGKRDIGGVGIAVFEDANFRGGNASFQEDVPDLRRFGLNDRISSVRIADDEFWELCEDANYRGRCQVFSRTENDLRTVGWNDRVSSLRRVRREQPGPGPLPGGRGRIELFSGLRFGGDRREFTGANADLRLVGFNDRAASLRLDSGENWEICRDPGFRDCIVVNADWVDLAGLGMRGQISSLRPWNQGRGRGRGGRGGGGDSQLILYDNRGFGGRTLTVDRDMSVLGAFANRAESLRIIGGGAWELCERPVFQGTCVIVSSDVSDLGRFGMRNALGSVRRR